MHVGFVTSSYPDEEGHPRGVFIHRLARGLVEDGLEVTVVAPGSDRAPAREVRDGISIRRYSYWLPGGQRLTRDLAGIEPALGESPWLAPQAFPLVARLIQGAARLARETDLLHAHWLYPAGFAAMTARLTSSVPLVVTSHGGDLNLARRFILFRRMGEVVARRADACIGVSPRDRETLTTLANAGSTVEFIPVGVDASRGGEITPLGERAQDHEASGFSTFQGLRVLYVGSLVPRKSVRTLLDSVEELRHRGLPVGCAIVGDGPEGPRLRKYARRRALDQIWFAGSRSPEEVRHWMATADLLVLPSIAEPWGSVVPEAMALGTPAIVSDTAGSACLIAEGRSGYTFDESDARALAARMVAYARLSGSERDRMGAAAREAVEAAGVLTHQVAARHRVLYESLLAGGP